MTISNLAWRFPFSHIRSLYSHHMISISPNDFCSRILFSFFRHFCHVWLAITRQSTSQPKQTGGKYSKQYDYLFLESISVTVESTDSQNRKSQRETTEHVTLLIDGQEIRLKFDTGAEVNVIPYSTFKNIAQVSKIKLRKPKAKLTGYNGQDIPVITVCNLSCKHKNVTHDLEFYITTTESEPILSIGACRKLELIKFVGTVVEGETAGHFGARAQSEYRDVSHRAKLGCAASHQSTQTNSIRTRRSCQGCTGRDAQPRSHYSI